RFSRDWSSDVCSSDLDRQHRIDVGKTNLVAEEVPSLQTAYGDVTASERLVNWATQGYFSRLMYNYQEKYLFEANVRLDGTSRFKIGRASCREDANMHM